MSSPESAVLFEVADGVATITLNRPEQMNSINGELSAGLMDALKQVRSRDDIRCAVITGNGRAFCAGADLRSRDGGPAASSGVAGLFRTDDSVGFHEFDANKPIIGAVNGYCLGGGFEIALTPNYNASLGSAWLERGGVYAVANIRGGGEFGPPWHESARKQNRQRAYDDFIAVAEDLAARKITSPQHLGIMGGSNGGLLMGVMLTERPDLFKAVVCQVPLLDMRRYNKLLAGASWMDEYGDPDKPEDWAYIQKYSPYQNVAKGRSYPRVLFTTSTRDDRVHPGHARKMVARMKEQGHDVLYYENIEGGHGGAANNKQAAYMSALAYTFLRKELMPPNGR